MANYTTHYPLSYIRDIKKLSLYGKLKFLIYGKATNLHYYLSKHYSHR